LPNSEIFMAVAVVIVLVSAFLLMAALGFADRTIFLLQLTFVVAAGAALWCAISKSSLTEYIVWTMYLTGLPLIVLMVRRLPRKTAKADLKKTDGQMFDGAKSNR